MTQSALVLEEICRPVPIQQGGGGKQAMKHFAWITGILMLVSTAGPVIGATDDEILNRMQGAVDKVLARVTSQRAELEQHPERIHDSVADLITPYFDFAAMTESAMGKYWPRTDASKRAEVVSEFTELLIRTYGSAVFKYSGKPIDYEPLRWSSDHQRALVPTKVEPLSGPPVPIEYKLHEVGGDWMVYDVEIDNISLVTNYRSTFANEIRSGGVDGLIAKLRNRNQELGG